MSRRLIYLTHADVVVDPDTPVPDWGLSAKGHARHAMFAATDAVADVTAIYASTERKAWQGAQPVADRHGLTVRQVGALGENDRSATGYLPKEEFEAVADRFFAEPDTAVRGWERARAAQARTVGAITTIAALDTSGGDILVVGHGGVGTLWRSHLMKTPIARDGGQPEGGGAWCATEIETWTAPTAWRAI